MPSRHPRITNRLRAIMAHINYLSIEGQARLAQEAGVSPSLISRMVRGQTTPSLAAVLVITRVLEERLKKKIDPREILNFEGEYPTKSVCELSGCKGCLPEEFYGRDDVLKEMIRGIAPGQWTPEQVEDIKASEKQNGNKRGTK